MNYQRYVIDGMGGAHIHKHTNISYNAQPIARKRQEYIHVSTTKPVCFDAKFITGKLNATPHTTRHF